MYSLPVFIYLFRKKSIQYFLFVFSTLLILCGNTLAQTQSIKNGISWYDTEGNLIQAHGSSIIKHEGLYYMVGEDRTEPWVFNAVNLYSSTDLINWKFRNEIVDRNTNTHLSERTRIVERPCLVYNPNTKKFVLWVKYQNGDYTNDKAAVFSSNTIDGKYTYHKEFKPGGYDSNDGNLFEDTDGSVYYISRSKESKGLNIHKLTSDFLNVESTSILFAGEGREAPVLMKKGNTYYLISSGLSGWDPNPLKYATSTASSPMTGWSGLTTISDRMSYDSQPTSYLQISGTSDTSYFYVGDRWKDPALPESKTVIYPLTLSNGTIDIQYVYEFKFDLEKGTWTSYDDNEYISQDTWSVISSTGGIDGNHTADKAIDNDPNTFWQTSGNSIHLHEIVIDLGSETDVSGFKYEQRNDNEIFGIVKEYELYLSNNLASWGSPVSEGWMSYTTEKYFAKTTARYMRFVAKSEHGRWGNTNYASAAELRLITNNNISKSAWTIPSVDSEAENNPASYAIDGDINTFWHTPWGAEETAYPHEITINLGALYQLTGFTYLPRQDDNENGIIREFQISVSTDGINWEAAAEGTWGNAKNEKWVPLDTVNAQYVKLTAISEINDKPYASAAEISLYGEKSVTTGTNNLPLKNSDTDILVYPNPACNQFTVCLNGIKNAEVLVYNSIGTLMTVAKTNDPVLKFQTESLFKSGMYLILVKDENEKLYSKKLIIR